MTKDEAMAEARKHGDKVRRKAMKHKVVLGIIAAVLVLAMLGAISG